ncbi:Bug family tripartite tricarboxylate transporter substrate binding protein [Pseudochelatococcus sp. B33]
MYLKNLIVSAGLLLAGLVGAQAQDYPSRPVTIVIPYTTGGGGDSLARIFASDMEKTLGRPVVVESRPGAASLIGIEYVANAPADGYTLLLAFSSITVNPVVFPNAKYKVLKDFTPVALLATVPHVMAVSKNTGATSAADFIRIAKDKPGQLNFGSVGEGSSNQLEAELFKKLTSTDIKHIPYQGGAAAVVDLIAGRLDMMFATASSLLGPAQGGKVVPIAVTGDKRLSGLPDIPTIAEAGVTGFNAVEWAGLFAPAGTPQPVIDKLEAAVESALANDDLRMRMEKIGFTPAEMSRDAFIESLENDSWSQIASELGIRIQQ